MNILSIETSTSVCSVAVSVDGQCKKQALNAEGQNHAKLLSRFIDEMLNLLSDENKKLDAVALSQGPGSYTGLRIGTSTAKGLCYGMDIPLIAIDTLQLIALSAKKHLDKTEEGALICPMIDARRMEVYNAFYDKKLTRQGEIAATVVDENTFADILKTRPIYFCGNGSEKCSKVLTHPNAHFIESIIPEAQYMHILAEPKLAAKETEDIAYFDPFYLKEFQATVSKNKLW